MLREACRAILAEIADHPRHHAARELPRRAPLALGIQCRNPQLSQRRNRRADRGADLGVLAEDRPKANGLSHQACAAAGAPAIRSAAASSSSLRLMIRRAATPAR